MHLGIKNFVGGAAKSLFGPGTYSSNVTGSVSVTGNNVSITGAATIAPDATTGACVLTCDTLTLDGASAALTPTDNSKGLIIFAKTKVELKNGAKLNIDKLGKAGNFGNLTVLDLVPDSLKKKLKGTLAAYIVLGEGAAGAAATTVAEGANVPGHTGSAASAMQTGGGGGGGRSSNGSGSSGAGGKGGPCCGGAGGGGLNGSVGTTTNAGSAGAYGGPAGDGWTNQGTYPGCTGAGDPVGINYGDGRSVTPLDQQGGGLLMLLSPSIVIGSGCVVSSDGGVGTGGGYTYCIPGGSAGGGCVCIVTLTGGYTNSGTVRANGGASQVGNAANNAGGAGGAGSVNILTV